MSVFCIQVQMSRAPVIDLAFIRETAAQLGANGTARLWPATRPTRSRRGLFTRYSEEEGSDQAEHYVNLYFDAPSTADAWPVIRSILYEDSRLGPFLEKSSIATCQGQNGWDDYLLLHHFRPTVSRDRL